LKFYFLSSLTDRFTRPSKELPASRKYFHTVSIF
jgi:hypothetical protein